MESRNVLPSRRFAFLLTSIALYLPITAAQRSVPSRFADNPVFVNSREGHQVLALRVYTEGSAYAAFQEHDKGSLAPGKVADVVVLSKDLTRVPPSEIKQVSVEMTIVGGRVVYDANSHVRTR